MIRIVTDSTANVPPDIVAQYGISVIPLKVTFGGHAYRDGVDINTEEFYRLLQESDHLPQTSQPSSGEFLDLYSAILTEESDIVSIHISSELSGTMNSAQMAREMLPNPERIHLVDSRFTALATGMMVIAAAEAAHAGKSTQEILRLLNHMIQTTMLYFAVDTLEYLEKGGRIGGAAAFLGTMMKIKPLLCFEDGSISAVEKVRTKSKVTCRMLDLVEQQVGADTPVWAGVIHTNASSDAEELADRLASRFHCLRAYLADAGPTLGTHGGPGCLGLAMTTDPSGSC
jgi:DegV family protein with EDD domain